MPSDFEADFVQRLDSLPRHRTVILLAGWGDADGSTKAVPEEPASLAKYIHQLPHLLAWRGKETLMLMVSKEQKQGVAYALEFLGLAKEEELKDALGGTGLDNIKPKPAKGADDSASPTPTGDKMEDDEDDQGADEDADEEMAETGEESKEDQADEEQ